MYEQSSKMDAGGSQVGMKPFPMGSDRLTGQKTSQATGARFFTELLETIQSKVMPLHHGWQMTKLQFHEILITSPCRFQGHGGLFLLLYLPH